QDGPGREVAPGDLSPLRHVSPPDSLEEYSLLRSRRDLQREEEKRLAASEHPADRAVQLVGVGHAQDQGQLEPPLTAVTLPHCRRQRGRGLRDPEVRAVPEVGPPELQ